MSRDLYEVIGRRRDVRREFTGAPIPAEVLDRVLRAAPAAPSVGLTQPWDFILVDELHLRRQLQAHVAAEREAFAEQLSDEQASTFARVKIEGILDATIGIVVTYDPDRGAPAVIGRHAIADAGLYSTCLAIQNLWLAATAEGPGRGLGLVLSRALPVAPPRYPAAHAADRLAVPWPGQPPGNGAGLGTYRLAPAPAVG